MLATIIIRARNEAAALKRLLPLLKGQRCDFDFEILLLDNDSQDASAEIARAAGVEVHHIPRDAFNYATSLNQGASLAQGDFVVNLSAHCYPLTDTWLASLVQPLRDDPNVIASYGRQWTDPQTAPFEALGNDVLFPAQEHAASIVAFSNANCAIQRTYILKHPFNPMVKILEDHLFYLELSSAYQFVYVPEAIVLHTHDSFSWRYYLRRWLREGWAFFFIRKHRGYDSPFAKTGQLSPRELFIGYPWLAAAFARRRKLRTALLTVPFFWLRDSIWIFGFLRAAWKHSLISQSDSALLLRMHTALLEGQQLSEHAVGLDLSEEYRLKADWGFIRRNIASFIRQCHDQGLILGPLLEVGASGQNDYLGEYYELTSSNLVTNMQTASVALDMEDMHSIADNSLGTVLCSEVIEHVRHPERAFSEALRVLRPGGTLIVTTPYSIVIHNTADDGGFHGRNFTPQGLELLAKESGFEIILLETRGQSELRSKLMPSNVFLVARKS